jgi:cytochrome P450
VIIADSNQFIYMLLSKHPEVVQKLREEHTRVFHANFKETIDILLDLPQKTSELEYTTAVIKETLRLFPVGFGVRKAEPGYDFLSKHSFTLGYRPLITPQSYD